MNFTQQILSWKKHYSSSLAKRLVWNSLTSVTGAIILQGMTFIAFIIVARYLGMEAFGKLGIIRTTVTTFVAYASLGMGFTMVKCISEWHLTDVFRVGRVIVFCYWFIFLSNIILSSVLFLIAPWFCESVMNDPYFTSLLRMSIFLIFFTSFAGIQTGMLAGFGDFTSIAITSTIIGITIIPCILIGAIFGNVTGCILGMAFSSFCNILINMFFVSKNKKRYGITFDLRGSINEIWVLWKYCLPTMLSTILFASVLWFCYILLSRQTEGLSQVAILAAAMQFYSLTTFIQSQTWRVFLAQLSQFYGQKDSSRFWKTIKLSLCVNFLASVVFIFPMILFSKYLLRLYGKDFYAGYPVLIILCLSAFVFSFLATNTQILSSSRKVWIQFFCELCGGVIMIILSIFFLHLGYGAMGVALAHLSNYCIQFVLTSIYLFCTINPFLSKDKNLSFIRIS
jgi:O-antigen/teichoic acid export membrane protein